MRTFRSLTPAVDWYYWSTVAVPSQSAEQHVEVDGPLAGARSVMSTIPQRQSAGNEADFVLRAEIGKALSALTDRQWRVVIRFSAFGNDFAEIGKLEELDEETVRIAWSRASATLHRVLTSKGVIR